MSFNKCTSLAAEGYGEKDSYKRRAFIERHPRIMITSSRLVKLSLPLHISQGRNRPLIILGALSHPSVNTSKNPGRTWHTVSRIRQLFGTRLDFTRRSQ